MLDTLSTIPIRVLVTGARGKSSLTRLLHAAFCAVGKNTRARITGVLPRELKPDGTARVIRRTSPAHIGELEWWLKQIPAETQALVVENSAISPDLQHVATALLRPTLTVWTTLRPDHTESWGPGFEGAARTLIRGIPSGGLVAAGGDVENPGLVEWLRRNRNVVHFDHPPDGGSHHAANVSLARLAVSLCLPDADMAVVGGALVALPPDVADFRIIRRNGDSLAVAFSANDTQSTEQLFLETGWDAQETTLLYYHRTDRGARLKTFLPWIASHDWKETVFSRAGRRSFWGLDRTIAWNDQLNSPESFQHWWSGQGNVFACGNVIGWPLSFLRGEI